MPLWGSARRRNRRLASTGRRKRPPATPLRHRPYAIGGGSPNKSTSESTSPAPTFGFTRLAGPLQTNLPLRAPPQLLCLVFFGAYELGILVIQQGFFFFQLLEMQDCSTIRALWRTAAFCHFTPGTVLLGICALVT
jgi:hypothetical protein